MMCTPTRAIRLSHCCFFYHINIGTPILSEHSRFVAPVGKIVPASDIAAAHLDSYASFDPPTPGYLERQYYHTLKADAVGNTLAMLYNSVIELGIYLRYNQKELPCLSQWKVCRPGEYVMAFEPGNVYPWGRDVLREKGMLEILQPMEEHSVTYTLQIVDGHDEFAKICEEMDELK